MLLIEPDEGNYIMSTSRLLSIISEYANEIALILLPGIQYYSGQLLDIATITKHAHAHGITIGWDLAHAAGTWSSPKFELTCGHRSRHQPLEIP